MSGNQIIEMEKYFGDVVVFESNSLEARLVTFFTGSDYNHSALRTEEYYAKNITKQGMVECDLRKPDERYSSYLILEHNEITDLKRNQLMEWDKRVNNEFSKQSILVLGLRHVLRKEENNDKVTGFGKLNCSSRIALLYELVNLPILDYIHHTQIEPHNFLESPYFKLVDSWRR